MILTKYEHACVVLEEDGKKLIIDPGVFSKSFQPSPNTIGVIVTHDHSDHYNLETLQAIRALNPAAEFFGPADVAEQAGDLKMNIANVGEGVAIGPFHIEFYGGQHELIHPAFGNTQNVGIFVNGLLYYPGDSFVNPDRPVKYLLAPVAAPWLKVGEAINFITDLKPVIVFPTHDAIINEAGQGISDSMIGGMAESTGAKYQRINTAESVELIP